MSLSKPHIGLESVVWLVCVGRMPYVILYRTNQTSLLGGRLHLYITEICNFPPGCKYFVTTRHSGALITDVDELVNSLTTNTHMLNKS